MMAIDFLGAGEILGAMITPALLISAAGTLSLSTANRLGRVVDRVRALTDMAEANARGRRKPAVNNAIPTVSTN